MNKLINKLQKDLNKIQATIQKEGNDLLKKIKKLNIKDNLDATRREIESVIETRLAKLEPAYEKFMEEVRKNAKKTGIDFDKIEAKILSTTTKAGKKIKKTTKKPKATKNSAPKASKAEKNATKKASSTAKKTTRKPSSKKRMGNDTSK